MAVKKDFNKKIAIKVLLSQAKGFKESFNSIKPQAVFDYDGKSVVLKDIRFPFKNKLYSAYFVQDNLKTNKVTVKIVNDYEKDVK